MTAGPREAGDEAVRNRVACNGEHDRNDRGRLFGGEHCRRSLRDYDMDLEPHEFSHDLSEALVAPSRPAILDRDIAAFGPAAFAEPLHECGNPLALALRRALTHESDERWLWLLRSRRNRPHRHRAAEQGDELAAPHSITSSARASSVGGTSRPSTLAAA